MQLKCIGSDCVPIQQSSRRWSPSPQGWVKVIFDAHIGEGMVRGLGLAICDEEGKLLAVGSGY